MPQEQAQPYEPLPTDYRYRVTVTYAGDVVPPLVPGEIAAFGTHVTRESADQQIETYVAGTDFGRILLEERLANDVATRTNEWHVIHTWTREAERWQHQ